ncbi:hypothetical protein WN51_06972 [Melipona quadrifasciata]|uniref:Uncharacterized protein n=1 Tax=Melipona quadrifasciata TaxID=166423 RepID=A0A0M8ZQ03_9HYME|nr:hypothetical protein WN51_06972 [Melipona quadrifasciata]
MCGYTRYTVHGTPSARYTRVLPSRRVRFCSSCFTFCSFCSCGSWLFFITSRASPHAEPPLNASARPTTHARACLATLLVHGLILMRNGESDNRLY